MNRPRRLKAQSSGCETARATKTRMASMSSLETEPRVESGATGISAEQRDFQRVPHTEESFLSTRVTRHNPPPVTSDQETQIPGFMFFRSRQECRCFEGGTAKEEKLGEGCPKRKWAVLPSAQILEKMLVFGKFLFASHCLLLRRELEDQDQRW